MSTSPATAPPAPVRRIITGHTAGGTAVFAADEPVQPYALQGSTALLTDLFWQDGFPASNDGGIAEPIATHDSLSEIVNTKGSVLRAVDMPPRTESVRAVAALPQEA